MLLAAAYFVNWSSHNSLLSLHINFTHDSATVPAGSVFEEAECLSHGCATSYGSLSMCMHFISWPHSHLQSEVHSQHQTLLDHRCDQKCAGLFLITLVHSNLFQAHSVLVHKSLNLDLACRQHSETA